MRQDFSLDFGRLLLEQPVAESQAVVIAALVGALAADFHDEQRALAIPLNVTQREIQPFKPVSRHLRLVDLNSDPV